MSAPNAWSATAAVAAIEAGRLTAEALTLSCLERIAEREPTVNAWVALDREQALARARALDQGPRRGPLHGLPLGIKDIIETADLPTECGSPIYRGYRSGRDAAVVALSRGAGAVVLGKTVTTEFASRHPGPTSNPHRAGYTPGGSSSGSAAAVADRMVPAAFGTQTAGSVVRPASYCGVVGFKPSYNAIPTAGVKPLSPSLDTVGVLTRTVADAALVYSVTARDPRAARLQAAKPRRIGLCRSPAWSEAEPAMQRAMEVAARRLAAAGYGLVDRELPDTMADILAVHGIINEWESAGALAAEHLGNPEQLSASLRGKIADAARHDAATYQAALVRAQRFRAEVDSIFDEVDLLLAPAAPGEAPAGLAATGKAVFNAAWTLLHGPCISLPGMTGPGGLPVALQAVGRRGADVRLLAQALALEPVFAG